MTTKSMATDVSPKVIVLATGKPKQPGKFFVIECAATTSIFVVVFILHRVGLPFFIAIVLTILMTFAKTKALRWMEPQRISARSREDGAVMVQGVFRERTIPRNSEFLLESVGITGEGNLSIVLSCNAQPITLDTGHFRPERLQAIAQLLDAMHEGDASKTEGIADRHGLKYGKHQGNSTFILWEKPNAAALIFGAFALAMAVLLTLQKIAS